MRNNKARKEREKMLRFGILVTKENVARNKDFIEKRN